jgi:hypothetical protein
MSASLRWAEPKDPSDASWWSVNCESFLDDDTIATATFTPPSGLTKALEANTTTTARVKLSGGTAGTSYEVQLDITTAGGQTFQRTIALTVKNL